jgi:hypothetical protein
MMFVLTKWLGLFPSVVSDFRPSLPEFDDFLEAIQEAWNGSHLHTDPLCTINVQLRSGTQYDLYDRFKKGLVCNEKGHKCNDLTVEINSVRPESLAVVR